MTYYDNISKFGEQTSPRINPLDLISPCARLPGRIRIPRLPPTRRETENLGRPCSELHRDARSHGPQMDSCPISNLAGDKSLNQYESVLIILRTNGSSHDLHRIHADMCGGWAILGYGNFMEFYEILGGSTPQ